MAKVIIVYDSQTGFTQKMAQAIAEGVKSIKGVEIELIKIGVAFSIRRLDEADAIVFGSPVIYGNLTLRMQAFLNSVKDSITSTKLNLSGKIAGAFGSYTFSGGWVIRELSSIMENLGMKISVPALSVVDGLGRGPSLRLDEKIYNNCSEMGKTIARKVAEI